MKNKLIYFAFIVWIQLTFASQFFIVNVYAQEKQCTLTIKSEKAYFHDRLIQSGKINYVPKKAYLISGDQITINCLDKSENWIFASYKNAKGIISRGFINKSDLRITTTMRLSKIEHIRSMKGEYRLQSISGNSGANGLFDYERKNSKWSAYGSALNGGMREGYDIDISPTEMALLNTLKISISPDLTIRLLSSNKIFVTIPFIERGMDYKLKKPANAYGWPVPESLNFNTIFIDDQLFLHANENLTEDKLRFAVGYFGDEDSIILISYNTKEDFFTITISGLNTAVYTFK